MPDSDTDVNLPASASTPKAVDKLENDEKSAPASGDAESNATDAKLTSCGETGENDKSTPSGDSEPKADVAAEEAQCDTGGGEEAGEDSSPPDVPSNNDVDNNGNEGAGIDNEDGSDVEQERFPQQLWDLVESETREGGISAACGNRVIEWLPEGELRLELDESESKVNPPLSV